MAGSIEALTMQHATVLAELHKASFDEAWGRQDFVELFETPGIFGFATLCDGSASGFILLRAGGEEAEILTLAVEPAHRRRGLAQSLLAASLASVRGRGCAEVFLEVARDNEAALALYRSCGFEQVGIRPKYYRRSLGQAPVDALLLRRGVS